MKWRIKLFLKGMAVGAVDLVPGVSGGTIALISGIYWQLLDALSAVPGGIMLLLRGQVRQAWEKIHAGFLLTLLAGVAVSIFSFSHLISWLLENQPIALWSFFFGLVMASCVYIARGIRRWNWTRLLAFVLGSAMAWYITVAEPISWGRDLPSIFLAGAIAICAMLLPGVSGSFILLLMGLYGYILGAIKSIELSVMVVFAAGCAFGLVAFARLLKALLERFHDVTLALLAGFMLGSLNKIWPWRQAVQTLQQADGTMLVLREEKLWPWQYTQITGESSHLLPGIILAVTAILLIFSLEYYAYRVQKKAA